MKYVSLISAAILSLLIQMNFAHAQPMGQTNPPSLDTSIPGLDSPPIRSEPTAVPAEKPRMGQASAQGLEDLAGFWCESQIRENTQGTCIVRGPRSQMDRRARLTIQAGEIITIKEIAIWSNDPEQRRSEWEFRALREQSSSHFKGTFREFNMFWEPPWSQEVSATATVSPSRKVIVIRYRGKRSPRDPTDDVEKILMRME